MVKELIINNSENKEEEEPQDKTLLEKVDEANDFIKAIKEGTIRQVKSKFIYWDDKQRLFPK